MVPIIEAPRDVFTALQVEAMLRTKQLIVGQGCELLDRALNVIEDISADMVKGGTVSRSSYATLHGSCVVRLTRLLDWGTAVIRPYITLSDGVDTMRFNLGAYFTSTPETDFTKDPIEYEVNGVDILHALNQIVGESYAVNSETSYLDVVEQIIIDQGYTGYVIDRTQTLSVLPQSKSWMIDDNNKWLTIVNDLLGSIGYQGIWSDWNGRLRVEQYQVPQDRAPEWTYDGDIYETMLATDRKVVRDYFDAPNKWIALRTNMLDEATPVEGNGIFTYVNQFQGPTSVEARQREITAPLLHIEAADQTSLEAQARLSIDADIRLKTTIPISTSPNPLHWHFDRLLLSDMTMGPNYDVLGTQWTLPLNGDNMSHEWSVIEG